MDEQTLDVSSGPNPRRKVYWIVAVGLVIIALVAWAYVMFFSGTGADTNPSSSGATKAACPKIVPWPGGDYNSFVTWCQNDDSSKNGVSCVAGGGANADDATRRSWTCVTDEVITPDNGTPVAGEIPPQQQDQTPTTSPVTTTPEASCNAKSTGTVTWHYDPNTGSCTIVPNNTKTPVAKETPYEKFVRECQAKGTGYYFSGDPGDSSTWQCQKDSSVANKKPCGGDANRLAECKNKCKEKGLVCAENEYCGCRKPATPKEKFDDWWNKVRGWLNDHGITFI